MALDFVKEVVEGLGEDVAGTLVTILAPLDVVVDAGGEYSAEVVDGGTGEAETIGDVTGFEPRTENRGKIVRSRRLISHL